MAGWNQTVAPSTVFGRYSGTVVGLGYGGVVESGPEPRSEFAGAL